MNADLTGWRLVWSDEFDGSEVDASKWNVIDQASQVNGELQYYSPDEVWVEDGCLVIRTRRRQHQGHAFTSGELTTTGKFDFRYGRLEFRAKLPRGRGVWAAHYTLQHECDGPVPCKTWPPEIDVMELLGHEPNKVYLTNHYGRLPNTTFEQSSFVGPDFSLDFHTFAVEWEPDMVRWYVDGTERFRVTDNVPTERLGVWLNTAVGGWFPGAPDETTEFPQLHHVDYVRVYERLEDDA